VKPKVSEVIKSATTETTTAVVDGMLVTAAVQVGMRNNINTAQHASVWIRKTHCSRQKQSSVLASATTRTGKGTVFVTLATTTVDANMTKVIVATQKRPIDLSFATSKHCVNVLTRRRRMLGVGEAGSNERIKIFRCTLCVGCCIGSGSD